MTYQEAVKGQKILKRMTYKQMFDLMLKMDKENKTGDLYKGGYIFKSSLVSYCLPL